MNKLDINIIRPPKSDDKKTAALPSRKIRKLGRRRTGGIRFWDLGYLLDGAEYINLPFVDPHSGDEILGPGVFPVFDTLTLAYYDQLQALVFAVPQEDWKATFKQVDETYRAYFASIGLGFNVHWRGVTYLLSDPAVWNGDRFLPNQAATTDAFIAGINTRLVPGFTINFGSPSVKITTELDYTASAVAFVPSKSMDVFFMPGFIDVTLSNVNDYIVGFRENVDALDKLRFVYPRELFHDPTIEIFEEYLTSYLWDRISGPDTLAAYEEVFAVTKYWRDGFGGLRANRAKITSAPSLIIEPLAVGDYAPLSLFPVPPSMPVPVPGPGVAGTATMTAQFTATNTLAGALKAIIKKGGTYYYIWQD